MKSPLPQLPAKVAGYLVCAAIMGPWRLHGLARRLYPQLGAELSDSPLHTNLPFCWWVGSLVATGCGSLFAAETHCLAAVVLYILSGIVQTALALLIYALYPQGLPDVRPGYRHYKLNEWLDWWLPITIGLPLLLVAAGCGIGTCFGAAFAIVTIACLLSFAPLYRR